MEKFQEKNIYCTEYIFMIISKTYTTHAIPRRSSISLTVLDSRDADGIHLNQQCEHTAVTAYRVVADIQSCAATSIWKKRLTSRQSRRDRNANAKRLYPGASERV